MVRLSSLMLWKVLGFVFLYPQPYPRTGFRLAWYDTPMHRANAKLRFEAEQKLVRYEHVIKLQMAEIAKLRAENKRLLDWILGTTDALTCLQGIYQNPESSEYSKIKAATGALPFERPKLSVAVSVRGSDVLGECLDAAKAMKSINPPKIIDYES